MSEQQHDCRHVSFLLCGGHISWCPVCGAVRGMKLDGTTLSYLWTGWVRPGDRDKAMKRLSRVAGTP